MNAPRNDADRSAGSALVMALFILTMLTGAGAALLFLSRHEARVSQVGLQAKRAFYAAEAGLEDARAALFQVETNENFDDELLTAAGPDGRIDFDPDVVGAMYDSAGNVTGFKGFGDDVPMRAVTQVSSGGETVWYTAFLTNDPIDGATAVADTNGRVMLTAVGAGRDRSLEMVQAIVEPWQILPPVPPAAISLLGPLPNFDNGMSAAQSHTGNNCGVAGGPYAPILGTVSSSAAEQVQDDMNRPDAFEAGPFTGEDTVGDLTDPTDPIVAAAGHGTIDPLWTDCMSLKEMVLNLAAHSDYYCDSDVSSCSIPASAGPLDIIFIDGDLTSTPSGNHTGILVITGRLVYNGNTGWDGIILAIGEGSILRNGGGGFSPSGAVVVANIDPTPDGPNADKSDWCSTDPDGFMRADYEVNGGGNSTVEWCTTNIGTTNDDRSFRVVEFLQR